MPDHYKSYYVHEETFSVIGMRKLGLIDFWTFSLILCEHSDSLGVVGHISS